ncbi:MAG: PAS domain-containing protein [Gammaproteobacteria bacterium]|nr:PAS domain-containing protein [Gammaproteobacteria bacterium]
MSANQITIASNTISQSSHDIWYRLRLFNYFRFSLALFFITLYLNGWLFQLIYSGFIHTDIFITASLIYLVASSLFFIGIFYRNPGVTTQVIVHTLVDISCIILLMHATGGIRTGLGMLLIISVSMTSLFLPKQTTILFAAITTLVIIGEQIYSQVSYADYTPAFTQAGLLGILIFISAFLTIYTSKRLKESEKLAEKTSYELETIVQMNEHIIRKMRTGIMVIKNNGQILMANNAALELLGNITVDSRTNIKDVSVELYHRFIDWSHNAIQNHQPIQQPQGLPDLQPGFSHIDIANKPNNKIHGRTLVFIEDATKLAQRFQQIKLASLGRLTASIAHEIRNPLAAINHAGQLLSETSTDASEIKLTCIINTQTKRLNNIVENVLQLSRQQRGTPENIRLYPWLLQFREECVATHNLRLSQMQIDIDPQDIEIMFDSNQLHQVMWNLCTNAISHSTRERADILITIQGTLDNDSGRPYVDVIDNGPGIDKESQAHIFDPFFTTSSEGTGLGLYITKEVIESNRAKIRHISLPIDGTCFRIYFQQSQ